MSEEDFEDEGQFCADLARLGFDVLTPSNQGQFLRIRALKNASMPARELTLRFRGHDASAVQSG